jgi:hypothetical protein
MSNTIQHSIYIYERSPKPHTCGADIAYVYADPIANSTIREINTISNTKDFTMGSA